MSDTPPVGEAPPAAGGAWFAMLIQHAPTIRQSQGNHPNPQRRNGHIGVPSFGHTHIVHERYPVQARLYTLKARRDHASRRSHKVLAVDARRDAREDEVVDAVGATESGIIGGT